MVSRSEFYASLPAGRSPGMPRTGLLPCPGVQDLTMVGGGFLVSQGAVERGCPPGRQCDQRAVPGRCPLLEPAHQGPSDAAVAVSAADEDFLDPGHRPIRVEGQM